MMMSYYPLHSFSVATLLDITASHQSVKLINRKPFNN